MRRLYAASLLLLHLALPACGPDRPPAAPSFDLPRFEAAMADPDARLRASTLQDLVEASTVPPGTLPALTAALRDENRWVRDRAARLLARLGPAAAPAVPALTAALRDPDGFVRWRAAKALASMGSLAAPARAELALMAAAEDETELGRHWSAEALRAIDGE